MARKILIYSFVSCNINDIKEINDIVKSSYVTIMPLKGVLSVNGQTNHPLQPTYLILRMPPPPPHTLNIDASGGNNPCSLSDVAECSRILD